MEISSSGLKAERTRMEIAANNMANAHSTRGANGQTYQRKQVVFSSVFNQSLDGTKFAGVQVDDILNDQRPPIEMFAPNHPDADKNGMVQKPNISPIEEMLDMITSTRAYEANLSALKQSKQMAQRTLTLGRKQ